jgi:N-acetylmuramoyl-L-alanine amidase
MNKIFISPSNQTDNRYATGNTTEEEVCNVIGGYAHEYLTLNGYTVALPPRGQQNSKSITDANHWGAELYVCIHTNAGGGRGCEVYVYDPVNGKALQWARPVYNEVSAITPSTDRGIKNGSKLNEVRNSNAPCVYVECEFHDNVETATWILNNTENLGRAIAKGIVEGDGKTFIDKTQPEPTPEPTPEPEPTPDPEPTPKPDEPKYEEKFFIDLGTDELAANRLCTVINHLTGIEFTVEPMQVELISNEE